MPWPDGFGPEKGRNPLIYGNSLCLLCVNIHLVHVGLYGTLWLNALKVMQTFTYENSRRAMNRSPEICQESDRRAMTNSAGKYGEKCLV